MWRADVLYFSRPENALAGDGICGICSIAAFGIGNMVQSNSVADAVEATYSIPHMYSGIVLMVCTAAVILGGIKSIGRVTGVLVPIMIIFYMGGAGYIILANIAEVPAALAFIVKQAFNPTAAVGGFAGASIMLAIRMGVARGVFPMNRALAVRLLPPLPRRPKALSARRWCQ